MRDTERIKVIEAILLRQVDYLSGCQFRVSLHDPVREIFHVTFEQMTNYQLQRLRIKLQEYSLEHIEIIAKKLIEGQDPQKQLPKKKKRFRRHRNRNAG
jgi:hypothetical protein